MPAEVRYSKSKGQRGFTADSHSVGLMGTWQPGPSSQHRDYSASLVEKCRPGNVRYSLHRHAHLQNIINSHVYDIGFADTHHNLCTITKKKYKSTF